MCTRTGSFTWLIAGALTALTVLVATACAAPVSTVGSRAPTTIRVGIVGTQPFSAWRAGEQLDIFSRENIEVELVEHRGGSEAAQALVGGGIDFFIGDISHAIRLNQQEQDIRVVAASSNQHAYTLLGTPNGPTDLKSLRGKKVGITSPGSQTDTSMRWLLIENGLDPDRDVELVAIGGGPPMSAALQVGQISAGMVVQPFTAQAKQQNYPVIYDFTQIPYQGTVFMAKQSWLKDHGDEVRRVLAAYLEVVKLLKSDRAAFERVVEEAYPELDPEIRTAAAEATLASWPEDGRVSEEGVEMVFEFDRVGRGTTEQPPALSSFSDFSYLPAAP